VRVRNSQPCGILANLLTAIPEAGGDVAETAIKHGIAGAKFVPYVVD